MSRLTLATAVHLRDNTSMSSGTDNVFDAALALPLDERLELAQRLWESAKPPGVLSEDDPGFAQELERRVAAFEAGETEATEWEVVRDRIRAQLNEARQQ